MGVLAGRYADDNIRPEGSRASLRGGIYAERVSQHAVEAGNKFVRLARDAGVDPARLAIAWLMHQPAVVAPLIGPKSVEQLEHLLPVMDMTVSAEILVACDTICSPGSAVANFHNSAPWMKMDIGG
jgi:aryl-alcohol dehydrogenase-like predicted oxidoreductase